MKTYPSQPTTARRTHLTLSPPQSKYHSALSEKEQAAFYAAVWSYVWIIALAVPLFSLNVYVDARIAIAWREWLARRLLGEYFSRRAYYRLTLRAPGGANALDNPDQRITDDARAFADASVVLAIGVLRQLFYVLAFTGLLHRLAPGLVWFLIVYAGAATAITAAGFGRRLTALEYAVLRREADLRFDLVRLRENAESVAFYRAEVREAGAAGTRLGAAVAAARARAAAQLGLDLWSNTYSFATILVPALLLAPRYFRGEFSCFLMLPVEAENSQPTNQPTNHCPTTTEMKKMQARSASATSLRSRSPFPASRPRSRTWSTT
jgi:putative ATP-binding cassette transporter